MKKYTKEFLTVAICFFIYFANCFVAESFRPDQWNGFFFVVSLILAVSFIWFIWSGKEESEEDVFLFEFVAYFPQGSAYKSAAFSFVVDFDEDSAFEQVKNKFKGERIEDLELNLIMGPIKIDSYPHILETIYT